MIKKIIAIFVLVLFLSPSVLLAATSITDLNNLKSYYANQAKQAQQAALLKQQQAAQIQSGLQQVNTQIASTTASLSSTISQVNLTQAKIDDLTGQIKDQNAQLSKEQDSLNNVISSWYMEGNSTFLETILSSSNLSDLMSKNSYYDSVKQQMEGEIEKINQLTQSLQTAKDQQDSSLQNLTVLKKSQQDQNNYLQSQKSLQSQLLSNTTQAITQLTQEQKDNEAMVAQLQAKIDAIAAASVGTGGDVVSGAQTSWYYKQGYNGDEPWSGYKIGNYATIGTYGCLLTSLTMISDFYGSNYDPSTAAQHSSFVHGGSNDGALISTSIVSDQGSQPINWNTVDSELAAGHPVVVGVALGLDMGNSYGVSHFVVLTSKMADGRYAMQDPLGPGRGYRKSQIKAMRIVRP